MSFYIKSMAFNDFCEIPSKYTCQGIDISPPLEWGGVPEGTKSFVLIIDDPDAPDPKSPKMTWVHWLLYNIKADVTTLKEGLDDLTLPKGTLSGINDFGKTAYGGPCPPIGKHRYFFKLYALNSSLPDLKMPRKSLLLSNMEGEIIEQCEMVGLYQKL